MLCMRLYCLICDVMIEITRKIMFVPSIFVEQVKSYPRRAYNVDDSSLTLSEVGLSNKQEALFLELI